MTTCVNSNEANILSQYSYLYPQSFIDCVRRGVSWLNYHNNITYKTTLAIATDRVVYDTNDNGIVRVGIIDVDNPRKDLTYYEVKSIKEEADTISGGLVFKVEAAYKTTTGISFTMLPILHYDSRTNGSDSITKQEVTTLLANKADLTYVKSAIQQVTNNIIPTLTAGGSYKGNTLALNNGVLSFVTSDIAAYDETADATKIKIVNDNALYVPLSDECTIEGVKTFANLPISTPDPTQEGELVNKKYVDAAIAALATRVAVLESNANTNATS